MDEWTKKIHMKTIKAHGLRENFKKMITELFELKVEIADGHKAGMEEEIADVLNMHDKMGLIGISFDFANNLSIDETIDSLLKALSSPSVDINACIPVLTRNIVMEHDLSMERINKIRIKKMKRTKRRYWRYL